MAYHGVDRLVIHFLAVAEQGGVTRAAKTLNITQPALTRSIRLLEEHLGVSLFDRHASGVEPTVYGRMLARRARLMQLEFDHALSEIEAFAQGREGKISIGAVPAWETIYIPDAISAAREELANVGFTIVGGSSRPLLAALRDGTIDLACVALELEPHPEIIAEPLINMERVVVCKSDHPLASRKSVSAVDLLEYSWSHMKGDEITLSRLGSYFSAYGLAPPTIEVECESNVSLLSILKSTELLGTAPKPIAEHSSFEGLVILPIQGSLWQYKSGIAYRREPPPTAFFSSFLSYLRSSLPQTN